MKISKSLLALGVSAATVLSANAAFAAANGGGSSSVSTEISMEGNVPLECAVLAYAEEGKIIPFDNDASDLQETLATGSNAGDIERIQTLSATVDIDFDCNTSTVSIDVTNTNTTTPTDAPSGLGVTQTLTVTPDPGTTVITQNVVLNDSVNIPTTAADQHGDINVEIISEYIATGEELPEGNYASGYTVTVTAL